MSEIMAEEELIFDELRAELPEAIVRADEPLAKRTTLRVGGRADVYVEPSSEKELACVAPDLPGAGRADDDFGARLQFVDSRRRHSRGGDLPGPPGFLRD